MESFTPIATNTDYNCLMYYRDGLESKGWTTEMLHAGLSAAEGPFCQITNVAFLWAFSEVCESLYKLGVEVFAILRTVTSVQKISAQIYAIIHTIGLFIGFWIYWYFLRCRWPVLRWAAPSPNPDVFDWFSALVSALIVSALGIFLTGVRYNESDVEIENVRHNWYFLMGLNA